MRLLKTRSHTSKRPWYETVETRRKSIEGNADPTTMQTIHHCCVPQVWRGGRDEKGPMAEQTTENGYMTRKTIVESLPRTVSVEGGGETKNKRIDWKNQALSQGEPMLKTSHRPPARRGGQIKKRQISGMEVDITCHHARKSNVWSKTVENVQHKTIKTTAQLYSHVPRYA